MMKILRIILFSALVFFMSSLASNAKADGEVLRIVYPDYFPFYSQSEDGGTTGIFYELIQEAIGKRLQIEVIWETYPWKRCQVMVKEGQADAMITTLTPERLEYAVTHAHPLFTQSAIVFTYSSNPQLTEIEQVTSFEDILDRNLTIISYLGNGWIEKNTETLGILTQWTAEKENVWKMLAAHRGDLVVELPCCAWPDILRFQLEEEIVQTRATLQSTSFHLLVGKQSPHVYLLPILNEIILEMEMDGTIDTITKNYCR